MRFLACLACSIGLALATACAPDSSTAPDSLAPEDATFSRSSKTDEDANFKYDKDDDGWYCVKQYGTGPMFMDDADPEAQDTESTVDCEYVNYKPQKEL